jgi:hypothetical protein
VKAATVDKTTEKTKNDEKKLKRMNMGEDNPEMSMRKRRVRVVCESRRNLITTGMGSKTCNWTWLKLKGRLIFKFTKSTSHLAR